MAQESTTVYPNKIHPREWRGPNFVSSSQDLFERSCNRDASRSKRIIRSSFDSIDKNKKTSIIASSNGLVYSIFDAYCNHHHLIIRPEDVWFAILTQLSFYINANAEKLRSHFVSHQGKKEVTAIEMGTLETVNIGAMALKLTHEMHKHIVDEDLKDWIMPDFTTTRADDEITAAVIMMGSMQAYFRYSMCTSCGIPSIKLLGDKQDWVSIRDRLDKLTTFGAESKTFGQLLMPVLDNFILSYYSPNDAKLHDFWNKVCSHKSLGSGRSDKLSGWVTAFCFWDEKGHMLYRPDPEKKYRPRKDTFDSSIYHNVDIDSIPTGTVSVPVKFDDRGKIYQTRMVAGSVGIQVTSSGMKLDESRRLYSNDDEDVESTWKPKIGNRTGLDTLQPVSGWWMYELK